MSAFMVSPHHINAILACCRHHGCRGPEPFSYWWGEGRVNIHESEQHMGDVLYRENARSLTARYGDEAPPEDIGVLWGACQLPGRVPTLVEAFSITACYRYQACEAGDFDQTEAGALINTLREVMIRHLPGYDEAPWEWTPTRTAPAVVLVGKRVAA